MNIYVIVENGMVTGVHSEDKELAATILDLDGARHKSPEAFDEMQAEISRVRQGLMKAPSVVGGAKVSLMLLTGILVDCYKLKSRDEALSILVDNGADYQAMMLIANEYFELYENELAWHFPLSTTDYTGLHIIAVQEGFLVLPYNTVDSQDHELFEIEGAFLLDKDTAASLLDDWEQYSESTVDALEDMLWIISEKETT